MLSSNIVPGQSSSKKICFNEESLLMIYFKSIIMSVICFTSNYKFCDKLYEAILFGNLKLDYPLPDAIMLSISPCIYNFYTNYVFDAFS